MYVYTRGDGCRIRFRCCLVLFGIVIKLVGYECLIVVFGILVRDKTIFITPGTITIKCAVRLKQDGHRAYCVLPPLT
jgi:hypothetical protein